MECRAVQILLMNFHVARIFTVCCPSADSIYACIFHYGRENRILLTELDWYPRETDTKQPRDRHRDRERTIKGLNERAKAICTVSRLNSDQPTVFMLCNYTHNLKVKQKQKKSLTKAGGMNKFCFRLIEWVAQRLKI